MKKAKWLGIAVIVVVVGVACREAAATPTTVPTSTSVPLPTSTPVPSPTPTPVPSPTPEPTLPFIPGPVPDFDPQVRFGGSPRPGTPPWETDLTKYSIDFNDIIVAQVRDGIPSIDFPKFLPVESDPVWIAELEPVISLELNGEARAYPIQILIWHEIVNDVVGGVPVVVTFCPLCNTALVFERTINGNVHDFGTSGMLRFSDLVMYDRQTETWWQQIGEEAIVGELTGTKLNQQPAAIVSWQDFKSSFPYGQVLSKDTGFRRQYGANPYTGYDNINQAPFLFTGPDDDRLRPVERVTTVELNDEAAAYPFLELEKALVVNDVVGGEPLAVFFSKGTLSGLDNSIIAASRDVGAGVVYSRILDGMELAFTAVDGMFVDDQTGSTWNILGRALDGELDGKALKPVVHANHFWFAWAAFKPETRIWRASS